MEADGMRQAALRVCGAGLAMIGWAAHAQFTPPEPAKPNPAALFRAQCATCHTLNPADGPRQGPTLAGVVGRKAGSVPGFKYSPGFATADVVWGPDQLDQYLANPQSVIAGAVMPYRQPNPAIRTAIITYLQEQR
jgi:cytochrome c